MEKNLEEQGRVIKSSSNNKKINAEHCDICEIELTDDLIFSLSALYKAFSDENRLKIIFLLLHKELCVLDIADKLSMTQSNVSHQLKTLRQMRIVKLRKEGKNSYYSLDDSHIENILTTGFSHISHI